MNFLKEKRENITWFVLPVKTYKKLKLSFKAFLYI